MEHLIKKAQDLNIRNPKNLKRYEKKITPYLKFLIQKGLKQHTLVFLYILAGLLTTLYFINGYLLLGGLFMTLTAFLDFAKNIMQKYAKKSDKKDKFLDQISEPIVDSALFFGIICFYYETNYPFMLLAILLVLIINFNKQILLQSIRLKIKLHKKEKIISRDDLFLIITGGALLSLLNIALAAGFALTIWSTVQLFKNVFAVSEQKKLNSKKTRKPLKKRR